MNLSPKWVERLRANGHDAVHWSSVGAANAADSMIAEWASAQGRVVFTADLDFGSYLAASGASGPSVVQLRSPDLRASVIGDSVARAVAAAASDLQAGAFMTFDGRHTRLRTLPFRPSRQA